MKRILFFALLVLIALITSCKKPDSTSDSVDPPVVLPPLLPSSPITSTLRTDGTILVDNIPFFPFGAYSVNWTASDADRVNCLKELADAGFNVTCFEDAGPGTITPNLIQVANEKNIKVFLSAPNNKFIADVAAAYKNNKCILAYVLADDGDNGNTSLQDLDSRHADVKKNDNKHLNFLTLTGYYKTRRDNANNYTSKADIIGYQIYPITPPRDYDVSNNNALTETYKRTLLYVKAAEALKKPCLMHLQTFNWGSQAFNPRYPTVAELRNMLYSGLSAGVKGVLSYDFSFDLKNNQLALWNEFKSLRTDVTNLEAALMNGALTRVNTGDDELVASYWVYNNICYMAIVNTSYSVSKTVSIPLPATYTGTKKSLFSRMPNTLSVNGTNFTGTITAQEVQVFTIAKQ